MKERKNSEIQWIIFSVLSVIIPVLLAFILISIINASIIDISEILDSIIIMVFSIACSLLSICWDVNKQKSDKFTKFCFGISGVAIFSSWTTYIVFLTGNIAHMGIICICSLIIVILCCIFGIILGKKSDKNENETICLMHENCEYIRKNLMNQDYYNVLNSYTIKKYDLLCNPNEFVRIEMVIENIVNEKGKETWKIDVI